MRGPERTISDAELNAYVDGELLPERRAQVELWLAESPEVLGRVESWRRQNEIIQAAFSRTAHETLPASMAHVLSPPRDKILQTVAGPTAGGGVEAPLRQPSRSAALRLEQQRRLVGFTAVAFLGGGLVMLAAAATIGMIGHRPGGTAIPVAATTRVGSAQSFARRALEAQQAYAGRSDLQLDLTSSQIDAVSKFLTNKLGAPVVLPDFDPKLRLLGVRLTPSERGLAGFMPYDGPAAEQSGLLIARSAVPDTPGFLVRESAGQIVVWFVSNGLAYGLTGGDQRDRLVDRAQALRNKLSPTGPVP